VRPRPARLLPPGYFFLSLGAIAVLSVALPGPSLPSFLRRWPAIVLLACGMTLFALTVALFHRTGTQLRPFQDAGTLMTGGPFRLSRNPIYLGMALILTSTWLITGATTPVIVPVAFAMIIQKRFIEAEEEFLAEHFGDAYNEYRSRVRRWL